MVHFRNTGHLSRSNEMESYILKLNWGELRKRLLLSLHLLWESIPRKVLDNSKGKLICDFKYRMRQGSEAIMTQPNI